MQSWVWKMSTSSAIFDSPASRSSIEANTRSSRVSAGGEVGTSEYGARTGRKKSCVGVAERDDAHRHRPVHHRLGERQGVHDAAPGLGRVGDQSHPRLVGSGRGSVHSGVLTRPGSPVAIAAATSEARAAVSVTMQPACTSRSRWAG